MSLSANAYSGMTHLQDPSEFADDGYGSLMGGGGAKKKKKPVLVLDADELEQAHQAIAMGGQHIMEAEDEPEAMERIRMPSSMLGLAPMGSDTEDDEADYGLSDDDTQSFADQEPEDCSEEGLSEEEEMEDDSSSIDFNLDHLLRPASREERDPGDEESIPSIEEQLKKMRALPIQTDEEPAEVEASFDSVPEFDEPVAFQPEYVEPEHTELEQDEPMSFEPEDMAPLPAEPEQIVPQSFESQETEPEAQPEAVEWEELCSDTEEPDFASDEPLAAEDELPVDAGLDDSDWSTAEQEAELEAEPETDSEPELEPEAGIESVESWSEPEAVAEPECEIEQALHETGEFDLPEIEWAPEAVDAPHEFAEDAASEEEPVDAEQAEPVLAEEPDAVEADTPPAVEEDQWETPEAEWPQPEAEQDDPVELEVPAIEEAGFDEEAPLSFADEDVEEAEAFVPEVVPEQEPELPAVPRNALRARVYQMEEERHERGTSLLGRIWNRLLRR